MSGRPKAAPKHRGNGEGSVSWNETRQRWRVVITNPVRRERWVNGDRSAAEAVLADMRQRAGMRAEPHAGHALTVAKLVELWIAKRGARWSAARLSNVTSHTNTTVAKDALGRIVAERVTVDDIDEWLMRLAAKGHEHSTVRTYRSHVAAAFNFGIGRGDVSMNPCRYAEMPVLPERVAKGWLDLDQARRLVDFCLRPTETWGPLFVVCAMLGVRPGEAGGLTVDAIDFDAGQVNFRRAVKRRGNKAVGIGKTKTGVSRKLAAPPEVMAALRRQVEAQEVARIVHSDVWPVEWAALLFVNPTFDRTAKPGYPPSSHTLRKHLARICAEAGLPTMTPYELRHSCASIMLDRGADPAKVAAALGTSERMLREHYDHSDPVFSAPADLWESTR